MSVSIVIPAYNEYQNLTILIKEINFSIENEFIYEIIVVDDNSSDKTQELTKEEKFKNLKLIKNSKNFGQSYSILAGINEARYDTIITLDADLQNNPKDIIKLYKIYISNSNIKLVGGIRNKRKDNMIKILSSRVANKVRSLILKDRCIDTGCSLKIFDRKIFLTFPFFNGIHRFLPALFSGYNYSTTFVNVDHRARKYGNSNYGTIGRMIRGIRDIYRVKKIIKNYNINND